MRALAILEAIAASDERPLSTTDLIETVGLPKATVHRLCALLEHDGYLRREPGGKRLITGPALTRLTYSVLAGTGERTPRRAILQALAGEIEETCNISVPNGTEMIYYDRVETKWPLRLELVPGSRVPLHCTASGKLFLSTLSKERRRRVIGRLSLDPLTSNTITDPMVLEQAIARIKVTGVGTDDQEFLPGMVACAVPVVVENGRFCMAVAAHAPAARLKIDEMTQHVPALKRAAAELSALVEPGH